MHVLILDFDFFSTTGGGQTFYRRIVERHPEVTFHFPSRGTDLHRRGALPANAAPFGFDPEIQDHGLQRLLQKTPIPPSIRADAIVLCGIAAALQGHVFDVVEVPSFRALAHLVRPILGAFGVRVDRVSLGLLGWISVSLSKMPDMSAAVVAELEEAEAASIAAADVCYTVSALHANETLIRHRGHFTIVDMHDVLEDFAPPVLPPGEGPPDVWFVGRLDPAKGSDLFLQIMSKAPRTLYRSIAITGPDNWWAPEGSRWSDDLVTQGKQLGLDIIYHTSMNDHELRAKVYRGRSIVVIPSRTDTFNFVALEALAHGVPMLLSRHTGAAGFLQEHHADIAPPIIEPQDVEESGRLLTGLLASYEERATALCAAILRNPLPTPRQNFLIPLWTSSPRGVLDEVLLKQIAGLSPLSSPAAQLWRPSLHHRGNITAVVATRDHGDAVRVTVSAIARHCTDVSRNVVIDDGSEHPVAIESRDGDICILRQGRRGLAAAVNRGCAEATGDWALLFLAGDVPGPHYMRSIADAIAIEDMSDRDGVGTAWAWLSTDGQPLSAAPAQSGWNAPGIACRVSRLLDCGGFATARDSHTVLATSLRLAKISGATPVIWRARDAETPWQGRHDGAEGSL
jgi:glycosyltransferase involved in cell wall biosynthesis